MASSAVDGAKADNPGIDAGIVRYNLVLDKALTSSGPYYEGGTVTYSLTPSNDGPVDALKGWSVTDILPVGLTLVSMTGTGYDCTTTPGTCVSKDAGLAAGQKGNVITVTATIGANVTGDLKNVAYVSPSQNDGPETIPLVTPDLTTDTTQPNTDNDDEQKITVLSKVSIGDYVWLDVNRDGLQAGEAGIAGVTVTLTDAAGATRSTTTDASGYYWFDDLTPGAAYTLTFTKPTGYVWTTQNVAGDTADKDAGTDSDVNPADGKVSFTAPTSGSNRTGALVTDNPTLDAGLIELVSVGDYTWLDVNRDGIQDAGEAPLAGVTVNLYDAAGTLVGTKTTDAAGYYWFTDLLAGATYTIEFVKPAGYTYTPVVNADPTANKDGGLDSDAPVTDGKVTFVAEATGSNAAGAKATDNPTIDAGFVELVSIGDYVWYDRNRDGLQGAVADEPVVAGVVVNLYAADGTTLVKTTTTNAAGFYSFTDLLAGATYVVEFVKPADTVFTQANAAGNTEDTKDSDANVSTGRVTVVAPTSGAIAATTTDNPTIDAGLIELVSIGDFVWYDRNRDGQQSAGEPAVPGVIVNISGPDGFSASTTTDANGFYSFNNLIGGVTYTVEFVKPADTIFTSQNTGADATDSDADVTTGKVTVVAPVSGNNSLTTPDDPTIDAGLVQLVSVGDFVWWDTNRDGLQDGTDVPLKDVVVHLLDADGNPAVLPGGAPVTATTDAAGAYWFTNLIAGVTYQVKFDTPTQYVATTSNVSGDTSNSATADLTDSDPIAGVVTFTAPVTGDNKAGADVTDNPGLDAGFVKLVSVGDYVWYDANRDGVQSEGELPVEGVVVNLYDKDGKLVDSATTNADGFYSFINLLAGATYTIEFVKPANTIFTAAEAGAKDVDSNADVVFGKYTFPAPTDGVNSATTPDDPTIDAGLIELVSIGDYVWWDRDLDGLQSEGEPVVAGVTVNLLDADGNPAVLPGGAPVTTTTNAAGFYSFTNLVAGVTYQVQFVKPADTIFTSQDVEGDVSNDTTTDVADSDAHEVTGLVTVVAPATGTNSATDPDNPTIDAGLIELVSVGNYVWLDINRDGLQSEGEPVVAGVTVNLLDAEGNPAVLPGDASVTTVTDENGYYAFNNLIGGVTYRIEFVTPEGKVLTFQDVEGDTSNSIETDVADSDADQLTGLVEFVAPVTGDNLIDPMLVDNPTIDAGLVTLVSVGDYVWYDVDRDGVQDEGEAPVPGVTVNLYDEDGELLATATTDENGFYSFTDLWAGATYTIEFVKPAGTSFTSMGAGEDDTVDSNADVVSGAYTFQAPADGSNSAITPDDPTIDAGLVKYNLNLVKKLVGPRVVNPGDTVTFTLTPHNDGPVNALAGWSVTEVMPEGLTLVSMSGQGYTCTGNVCVASGVLPAGEFGPVVTVTATVTHTYLGLSRNVAYVDRAPGDGDETIPLGPVPAPGTDTDLTATDNDDAAAVIIVPKPTPTTTPTGTVTPTPSPTVTPSPNPTVTPTGTATPTGSVTPSPSPSSTGTDGGSPLPQTGTDSLWVVVGGLLLVAVGGIILVASRRRRSTQE
ncbi:MAG: carboxypeptidase regulatory-like domain-containing protein [Actinomycetales bacterium]|nr:carboxypeptidase regulatory-like domain-containing protein [Candidatus Phosphoribacter baldrii]